MDKKNIRSILELALVTGLLKRITRTGWQKKNVEDPESVAEHTYRVAILAMLLASHYQLDEEKIIKMALIHDMGETVIGDLIWEKGGKVIGSQKDKHEDEEKAIRDIFNGEDGFQEYIGLWQEYEEQESDEAKLLKQIDKLEMAIQAYEYEKEGVSPKKLQEFWDNVEKYLKGTRLVGYFNELKKMRSEQN